MRKSTLCVRPGLEKVYCLAIHHIHVPECITKYITQTDVYIYLLDLEMFCDDDPSCLGVIPGISKQ